MFALVSGTRVAQVSGEKFPVAPPLIWVEFDPAVVDVTTRWSYDPVTGTFLPPAAPPAPKADDVRTERDDRIERVYDWIDRDRGYRIAIQRMIAGQSIPQAIIDGWNWIQAMDDAYEALIAQSPIPDNYRDDIHWPVAP